MGSRRQSRGSRRSSNTQRLNRRKNGSESKRLRYKGSGVQFRHDVMAQTFVGNLKKGVQRAQEIRKQIIIANPTLNGHPEVTGMFAEELTSMIDNEELKNAVRSRFSDGDVTAVTVAMFVGEHVNQGDNMQVYAGANDVVWMNVWISMAAMIGLIMFLFPLLPSNPIQILTTICSSFLGFAIGGYLADRLRIGVHPLEADVRTAGVQRLRARQNHQRHLAAAAA